MELAGKSVKGEIVVVVSEGERSGSPVDPRLELSLLLDDGYSVNEAAKFVASKSNLPKSTLYKLALEMRSKGRDGKDHAASG